MIHIESAIQMKFSTDIQTKVLQCILYSIFDAVPLNINLITTNHVKFRNDFWCASDILRAINVNPRNQVYSEKLQDIVRSKLDNEKNKAGKDQQLLKQAKDLKTKINSQLFSKNVNQLAPQVWCITLLSEDDFGNTSISATCFDSLDDAKDIAKKYMGICESQYVVSGFAAVGIRKSRLNVMTITPVSLVR